MLRYICDIVHSDTTDAHPIGALPMPRVSLAYIYTELLPKQNIIIVLIKAFYVRCQGLKEMVMKGPKC